ALGSVSKNAEFVLKKLEITAFFDAVIDGRKIVNGKPNPEVFLKGAEALGLPPEQCLVFEDSAAGIEAAHRGGMKAIGIGTARLLPSAELTIPGFSGVMPDALLAQLL
ncbi:MAG: beta-phosphoglucomutase, partial [Clostridia bacterium]